jgi:putative tricarboxylic transport membrane protein
VAGPEAANNAAAAGTLAPLLSLGLPTSATAAIMLAAFQQYGLQPGPLLFESNPDLVWGMIAEPLHRQRAAARPQPARWPGCG